jgi:hypothetical protein
MRCLVMVGNRATSTKAARQIKTGAHAQSEVDEPTRRQVFLGDRIPPLAEAAALMAQMPLGVIPRDGGETM